ncbi:hypothetical protein XAP412_250134 [Xanthomonas phaseoli pv. phaseoli]|uniref:Uncharacterized protein n=1 Tax=Xanthomonas campestris pv. phaseoli TaxID=317013 RepID=A0AB38DZ49_XANCH|nr:hypothetical protein XAP6984_310219 [Xanthomonas phaseoli pv. phaseoli]SON82502.1 hypothetical protein XAP412_250134 [Xanthomonas phaseoli pv. phaseoli]SON86628.1 hypothetical protein XAP7430_260218 [Xanthomonas phaseoli pv. phaseoli]SOO27044.1 hypothetical protein XAP6164_1200003 [Xanthomonas phaseoli pv. phaseoli]
MPVTYSGKGLFRGVERLADLDTKQPVTPAQRVAAFSASKRFDSTLSFHTYRRTGHTAALTGRWRHAGMCQCTMHRRRRGCRSNLSGSSIRPDPILNDRVRPLSGARDGPLAQVRCRAISQGLG